MFKNIVLQCMIMGRKKMASPLTILLKQNDWKGLRNRLLLRVEHTHDVTKALGVVRDLEF